MTTDPNNQDASDSGEHDMVLPARSKTAPHAAADAEHGRGALGACRGRRPSIDRPGRCICAARPQAAGPAGGRRRAADASPSPTASSAPPVRSCVTLLPADLRDHDAQGQAPGAAG